MEVAGFSCRSRLIAALALAATVTLAPVLAAPSTQALSGQYSLSGETLLDPPADEARDTQLNLYLDGAAAAELFRALPGEALADACLDDGSVSKSSGAIGCTRMQDGRFECAFAVVLATGQLRPAQVC